MVLDISEIGKEKEMEEQDWKEKFKTICFDSSYDCAHF